jgi:ABC-2 type transport system ATP-binding protein
VDGKAVSVIRITHLSKHFGTTRAVDDLTLHVPRGELFCFLGPNGAGKTTTIKILTGLLRATTGTARIGGIDIQEDPVAAKRIIGYVPDMPFLYDRLTVTEFFEFTGDLYDIPAPTVAEELEASFDLFGLQDYRHVLVKDLSHGLKHRLIYAATFLHRPEVLFIDEPMTGLDPHTIRLMKDLLRRKAREGMTVFVTTHILALAEDIADRIGIILEGRLIAVGTLSELVSRNGGKDLEDAFLRVTGSSDGSGHVDGLSTG